MTTKTYHNWKINGHNVNERDPVVQRIMYRLQDIEIKILELEHTSLSRDLTKWERQKLECHQNLKQTNMEILAIMAQGNTEYEQ